MTSILPFQAADLLNLNSINLDVLTENYQLLYYTQYLIHQPKMFFKAVNPDNATVGYMIGKSEGHNQEFHSHITALTVDSEYRRLGIARELINYLRICSEDSSENCYFMDLFVRATNSTALGMYERMGFRVFRRVLDYYRASSGSSSTGNEDAFDMRMPLKRDKDRSSLKKHSYTFEDRHATYSYAAKDLKYS